MSPDDESTYLTRLARTTPPPHVPAHAAIERTSADPRPDGGYAGRGKVPEDVVTEVVPGHR